MLGEAKDPAIKLFGKTIPLPEFQQSHSSCSLHQCESIESDTGKETAERQESDREDEAEEEDNDGLQHDKELAEGRQSAQAQEEGSDQLISSTENLALVSGNGESPRKPPLDKESCTPSNSKPKEKQTENGSGQDQKTALKKPDKILPCPRCNSMETKFCYYNNYNVNQPRHFCKNCQRYWTAGGTMRNVPVGAGRRKSKSSSAFSNNNRQAFAIPEALENARSKILSGVHQSPFEHPGSSGKISAASQGMMTPQGFPSHISCFPGAPWPYPWISPSIPLPTLCSPPTFPMPIYPVAAAAAAAAAAAYWGGSAPANWSTVPGLPQPPSPNTSGSTNPSSGTNSLTLGKHPREDTILKRDNFGEDDERNDDSSSDQRLWVPKTLRIDDPTEAAKSSIWTTLGINKNDNKADSASRTLFKAFQPKVEEKNRITEPSPVLKANPAALSQSLNFQEIT